MASKNFLSSKTLLRALAECGKNSSSDVMVLSLPFEVFKYHDLIEINRFANEIIDDESSENYFSLIVAEDEEQAEELETKKQELNPEDAKKVKIIDVYKAISERTSDKQIDGKKLLITFSGTIDKEGSYKVFDPLLNKIGGIDDQSIINFEQLAIAIVDILNSRGEGEAIEIASDDLAESLKFLSDVYKASENLADSFGALPPSIQWWKHLNLCLKYIEDYDKDLDEDELESLHLSMFGLPCPDNKKNYTKNNTPKAYAMTVKKYWSDHDLIASSIANLKLKKDDGKTSIEDIYDQFEFKKERDNHSYINSAIALCNQYDENGNINTKWLESWLTIEEKDFFHPYPQTKEKKFTVKRNGKKLSSSEIANVTTSKNILYLSIDENIDDLSNDQWILNQINLEYEDRLQKTNDLKITPASIAEWDEIDDSNGILTGNIIIKKPYKRVFKKPIEIELSCEHTRTRDHFRFVAKILITNPCLPSITVAEGKRVTHFNSWEFDFFDGRFETKDETYNDEYKVKNDSERILIEIYDGTKERLVETTESIDLDDTKWQQNSSDNRLFKSLNHTFQHDSTLLISPDNERLEINIKTGDSELSFNPFLSIYKNLPVKEFSADDDQTKTNYDNEIRSQIEEYYLNAIKNREFEATSEEINLGQIILSTNDSPTIKFSINDNNLLHKNGLIWCEIDDSVPDHSFNYIKTPHDLDKEKYLDELKAFLDSFYALELDKFDKILSLTKLDLTNEFKLKLNNYLDAFNKLIEKTKAENDSQAFFWASYPFSTFIAGSRRNRSEIKGVMISPLHPLRLVWYFSCQKVIHESVNNTNDSKLSLLSVIDGFDFPFFSKAASLHDTKMFIATPISNGFENIFITWSYLKNDEAETPLNLSGYFFPASSSTGLGAYAVKTAINDYLYTYPHSQSLNINIHSDSKYRDLKIDKEIINSLNRVTKQKKLVGGFNLFDSESRAAHQMSQHEELVNELEENAKLNWQHADSQNHDYRFDLTFRQDDDTEIAIMDKNIQGGALPEYPIRRFFTRHYEEDKKVSFLNPITPSTAKSWEQYNNALNAVETTLDGMAFSVKNTLYTDGDFSKTKWSILGDYLLDPVATNMTLASEEELKILWDWKPPNFYQDDEKELNLFAKRPYVTISKIDSNITNNFKRTIKKTIPTEQSEDEVYDKFKTLMQDLGLKGIGLSSLLNQDINKASGALGFFYAYRLIDKWTEKENNENRIISVLPLDTVDGYMKSFLGNDKSFNEAAKRADLLVITIEKKKELSHISLLPIEVKSYGINSQDHSYPKPPNEAMLQLKDTLKKLKLFKNELNNSDKSALKNTSLASLIDASFILSSMENSEYVRNALEDAANGDYKICTKSGLILYFVNRAAADAGKEGGGESPVEIYGANKNMKVLFADPYSYHEFFWGDQEDRINEKFSQTIGWCLDDINEQCLKEIEESTESLDEMIEESENIAEDDQIDNENASTLDESDLDEEVEEEEQNNDLVPIIVDEELEINKGVEINIGTNMNSSSDLIWYPSLTETTNQLNMGVIGDLGSGKTQLLKSIMYQTIKQTEKNRNHKIKFLILDYKEDYTGERDNFINHIGGKIIEPRHIPLNIFNTKNKREGDNIDELQKTKGRVLYTFFNQLYRNIGPVQKDKLLDAVEAAYSRNENDPTIRDVYQEYRSSVRVGDSVSSILRDIVDLNIFSNNDEQLLSFEEFFDQSIVINLAALGTDIKLKVLIVTIILQLYYEYMLSLEKHRFLPNENNEFLRQIDSFVLVDEANELMKHRFDFLEEILTKGREFGVGVILASQYFSHFKTRDIDYTENLATWNIMLEKQVKGRDLESIGILGSHNMYSDKINKLKVHQLLHQSYNKTAFVKNHPFFKMIQEEENDT